MTTVAAPIHAVARAWERIAPLKLAETAWDNVGIMIESPFPRQGKQVLLTIDLTTAVCEEALALPACSIVIAYHPPIFRALKTITMANPIQASLLKLAAQGISVFTPHTSLDAAPNGLNTWLASAFEQYTASSEPISKSKELAGFEGAGMGRLVKLSSPMAVSQVVKVVKAHLKLDHVQLATPDRNATISSIAMCPGSGATLFRGVQADLLLTGEMSHHEVLAAVAEGQSVILCNHSNTERPYLASVLKSWIEKELNVDGEAGWSAVVSQVDADPLSTV